MDNRNSLFNAVVEIVWDSNKGKLRARLVNGQGWTRFPNDLRIEGAMYVVAEMRPGAAGSWIACGGRNGIRKYGQKAA